jgi:uncharacterized protein (TIGR02145 family)
MFAHHNCFLLMHHFLLTKAHVTWTITSFFSLISLAGWAQNPDKNYIECNHDSLLVVLRAYEDSLALSSSTTVVRADYAWRVTDVSVGEKVYKIYRCEALYDSLEVLMEEVAFARMTPPVVDTDSIGSIAGTGATFYGKVTSDGDTAVTVQWFKYGLSAGSLSDSLAVSGVATPFSAVASGLANGTTYFVAAFAKNVKGTAPGDTLSFTTLAKPTVDTDLATSVAATTATLNARITATGGAAVTAAGFKYGTDAGLTTPTDVPGSGPSSPFTAALTGLTGSTQYWAVGYATNSAGTSYGDTITFTTASAFTCGTSTVSFDGYAYSTVLIGAQCWFAENVRADNYNNGDLIPGNLSNTAWYTTSSGAHTVFDEGGANEATNLATYGRLYNWHAVNDARGLCPTGWHVPTDAEWTTLTTALGGASVAGTKLKTAAWGGDNSSGFGALPGGIRFDFGDTLALGTDGNWWSSSPHGSNALYRYLYASDPDIYRDNFPRNMGFSVRCAQDPAPALTVVTEPVTLLSHTAATLNATIAATGGAAVTATGFKYATNSALSSPTDVAGSGTSSPFKFSLTGLPPSTQYWAVGYATNSAGTSYGDTITFTTNPPFSCTTASVNYDGDVYPTVQIGTQCWFAENLRNDSYNDGTPIPDGLTASQWASTSTAAQAIYNDDPTNLTPYGRLYNWYAVSDPAGLCPTGWHVPTDAEWTTLTAYLGGLSVAGTKLKTAAWGGDNSSGFTAVPAGHRGFDNGNYYVLGSWSNLWTSTLDGSNAWFRDLNASDGTVSRNSHSLRYGFSVRCILD